ncbi:MAG: SIMPL domain-containing protein [Leptolyngbyaceae cyanobacterium]
MIRFSPVPTVAKLAKPIALGGLLLIAFACGRASSPPSSVAQSYAGLSRQSQTPPSPPHYDPANPRFIVPPELAVMTITITTVDESFAASTQLVQAKTQALLDAVTAGPGCSAQISDYAQPVQPLGRYLRRNAKQYISQMTIDLEIDLDGLTQVRDRLQRLDDCVSRIPEFIDEDGQEDEAIAMTLSAVLPTVRDATVHRSALLQQRFQALQAVATAQQPPPQFQPSDLVCTSNGTVSIVSHQLSGVELAVDFSCDRNTTQQVVPQSSPEA